MLENISSDKSVDSIPSQVAALDFGVDGNLMHYSRYMPRIASKKDSPDVGPPRSIYADAMNWTARIDKFEAGAIGKFVLDQAAVGASVNEKTTLYRIGNGLVSLC